jgi:hypothetical protein
MPLTRSERAKSCLFTSSRMLADVALTVSGRGRQTSKEQRGDWSQPCNSFCQLSPGCCVVTCVNGDKKRPKLRLQASSGASNPKCLTTIMLLATTEALALLASPPFHEIKLITEYYLTSHLLVSHCSTE